MKCFKKIASLFVVLCFVFTNTVVTYVSAASNKSAWTNGLIEMDSYSDSYYEELTVYRDNDTIYVIAILSNGKIHLAIAPIGANNVQSIEFGKEEIEWYNQTDTSNVLLNRAVAQEIIAYGKKNSDKLQPGKVYNSQGAQTLGYSSRDYNAIMDELEATYGSEHVGYNWTGMTSQTYQGNRYNYKENFTHTVEYNDSYIFEEGADLANIIAGVTSMMASTVGTGVVVSAWVISILMDEFVDYFNKAKEDGAIASYFSNTLWYRYVLINNDGPYFECTKDITNYCWIVEDTNSVELEEAATIYSTSEDIFEDYTRQREIAYANYA